MHTLHTLTYNKLIMRKKSGVGNGEGSVGNGESSVGNGKCGVDDQSGSFSVAHTGNAKIWKTHCPTRWDKTSHPLGQVISLFSGVGKILSTPYIHRYIHRLFH